VSTRIAVVCDAARMQKVGEARRRLLIVEDDPVCRETIDLASREWFEPIVAPTVGEATAIVDTAIDLAGAVIDIGLPDGSGFEVIERLRARVGEIPILVLTAAHDPEIINRAHSMRAEFVCKPFYFENLLQFMRRTLHRRSPALSEKLASSVSVIAREHHLSAREAEILALAVDGIPRSHIARALGISENTIKTHIRSLLDKLGHLVLSDAVWWVRSRAGG
jgi:DNA-binding NarL/FixJ family response regulator